MKASAAAIGALLDRADSGIRLYLLYGADDAGARALAMRLERALGEGTQRVDLDSVTLKDDPARLVTEAASISLFGGRSWIRAEIANAADALPAIDALLAAPATANPVVAVAGMLKADSVLLKRLEAERAAISCEVRKPVGESAERMAAALGREAGLRLAPGVATRLAAESAGDRALLANEIVKYALFLDAATERPQLLDDSVLDVLGADAREGEFGKLAEAVLGGQLPDAAEAIALLADEGIGGIPLLRTVGKRALSRAVGGSDAGTLARTVDRLLEAERDVKGVGGIGPLSADAALIATARAFRARG